MFSFKKSFSFFFLLIGFCFLLFSACRTKDGDKSPLDFSGVELTYYKVFDNEEVLEPIIQQYEIDHPGLKINYRKFSDFDEYQKTILNEMSEGKGPDIFSMQNTWFAGNFRKLAPMPKEFGAPKDFAETFVEVAYKDLVRVDENGEERVFALPMTVDTLAIYYNKAHFEDRIPTRGRPSETWDGIMDDVAKLTKIDSSFSRFEVSGIAMGRADNVSRAVDILYTLFLQYGIDFYNQNVSEASFAGRHGADGDYPALKALKFFTSFADPEAKNYSWNEFTADGNFGQEVESFAQGRSSMIFGYSYTYDDILNEISLLQNEGVKTIDVADIKVAPMPQLFDPRTSTDKRVSYASYFAETVSRNSENADIAWDFLIELTTKKNLEYYFDKLKKPTSRRDMIEDQKKHPIFGVFASQIGYAESFPIMDYYRYREIFADVINRSVEGRADRAELIDAQDLINNMLPSGGLVLPKREKSDEELEAELAEAK